MFLRDLKLDNFLFEDESPDSNLKLIDFGLSAYFSFDASDSATRVECNSEVSVSIKPIDTASTAATKSINGDWNAKLPAVGWVIHIGDYRS